MSTGEGAKENVYRSAHAVLMRPIINNQFFVGHEKVFAWWNNIDAICPTYICSETRVTGVSVHFWSKFAKLLA
jgi:hypothetical protein